ncbi:MAG: hypothetical protein CMF65_09155 [Magnetovibrio sp.]|nr:hypothetical protein [Magnetovibrio sp.]
MVFLQNDRDDGIIGVESRRSLAFLGEKNLGGTDMEYQPKLSFKFLSQLSAFLFLLFLAFPSISMSESHGARNLVQSFQNDLVKVMKIAESLPVADRYDRLAPVIDRTFHMSLMAQISSGNQWQRAIKEDRDELVMAFRRMSIATLATLFSGYNGEVFKINDERPGPQKTTVVTTTLTTSDGANISIAYIARKFKIGWRLIDVILDSGISELKVRRSEYRQVLHKQGVPGLILLLNNKANELISE